MWAALDKIKPGSLSDFRMTAFLRFNETDQRGGGELSDLESVPSSILQILHPDIIDSQTLHSDGKFELPLGNKYFDFARCNFPSCWCTSSEVAFLETGRCSPRS